MSNFKSEPTTWDEANSFLGLKDHAVLGYKTKIRRDKDSGEIRIEHHYTDIVVFDADKQTVTYRNGGWVSGVTTDRLHAFSPMNVRFNMRKGTQYVTINGVEQEFNNTLTITFED